MCFFYWVNVVEKKFIDCLVFYKIWTGVKKNKSKVGRVVKHSIQNLTRCKFLNSKSDTLQKLYFVFAPIFKKNSKSDKCFFPFRSLTPCNFLYHLLTRWNNWTQNRALKKEEKLQEFLIHLEKNESKRDFLIALFSAKSGTMKIFQFKIWHVVYF